MPLFDYQQNALARVDGKKRCAFYHDMGLGKTYTGAAKILAEAGDSPILVVCQKSKVHDWVAHFRDVCKCEVRDLTSVYEMAYVDMVGFCDKTVYVINYDLIFRRPQFAQLDDFALMFDESSLLQNEKSKRTKAAMRLAERAKALVLLSGTPVDGKYERLWSQLSMLGWSITQKAFWSQYVETKTTMHEGFPITTVVGYKHVDRLRSKMHDLGCDFLKTAEVLTLPEQRFIDVECNPTHEYAQFMRDRVLTAFLREFVGDTTFGMLTSARLLLGAYSEPKLNALTDILNSTRSRVVVFYNFTAELDRIVDRIKDTHEHVTFINGDHHDLTEFHRYDDSIALVQYQAGAMGLNMQDAAYTVYFSPPLASSLFEQSKKRTHRVGQTHTCTYYLLKTVPSIETRIYAQLALRRDYTEALFDKDISWPQKKILKTESNAT